jgi:hypothetical protein
MKQDERSGFIILNDKFLKGKVCVWTSWQFKIQHSQLKIPKCLLKAHILQESNLLLGEGRWC